MAEVKDNILFRNEWVEKILKGSESLDDAAKMIGHIIIAAAQGKSETGNLVEDAYLSQMFSMKAHASQTSVEELEDKVEVSRMIAKLKIEEGLSSAKIVERLKLNRDASWVRKNPGWKNPVLFYDGKL